jgi:hypothetical protein
METREVKVYLSLQGIECEGIVDVPAHLCDDGKLLFDWIMNGIEVDWDEA